jgi:ketosteroid isomerase-like protein
MRGDRAFVDDLLTDDWTSTDYQGRIWTKANVLALFGPNGPTFTKVEIDVDRVRLLGDVAVVTGRSVSAGRFEGRDINVTQRYMDIYVRRDGRWRVVASQGTQVQ